MVLRFGRCAVLALLFVASCREAPSREALKPAPPSIPLPAGIAGTWRWVSSRGTWFPHAAPKPAGGGDSTRITIEPDGWVREHARDSAWVGRYSLRHGGTFSEPDSQYVVMALDSSRFLGWFAPAPHEVAVRITHPDTLRLLDTNSDPAEHTFVRASPVEQP